MSFFLLYYSTSIVRYVYYRAHVLARYDGVETVARILGTVLSPIVFEELDYYGSYGMRTASTATALIYLVFFVKEPLQEEEEKVCNIPDLEMCALKPQPLPCRRTLPTAKASLASSPTRYTAT